MIVTERRNGVGYLTINRPEARNALTPELQHDLVEAFAQLDSDPSVGAILITGAGGAFCAGGDIRAMLAVASGDHASQVADLVIRETIVTRIRASDKVVIARIQGAATGAGLAIALACDLRICDSSARFGAAYSRVALTGDFGISWLLPAEIGAARARQMLLTAAILDAETALGYGIVHERLDNAALDPRCEELAQAFAHGPRRAYAAIKRNLAAAAGTSLAETLQIEAEALITAKTTPDHREAIAAFIEKRAAVFGAPGET